MAVHLCTVLEMIHLKVSSKKHTGVYYSLFSVLFDTKMYVINNHFLGINLDRAAAEGCAYIQVILKNGALGSQGNRQGVYGPGDYVNERLSWESPSHAIWYLPQYRVWCIGAKSDVGIDWCGLFSAGDSSELNPNQVPYNNWRYWGGSYWLTQQNNIIVKCVPNTINIDFPSVSRKSRGHMASLLTAPYTFYNVINGSPAWVNIAKKVAIWYIPHWEEWAVGQLDKLGSNWRMWSGLDTDQGDRNPHELPDNSRGFSSWYYWAGSLGVWLMENANSDISVKKEGKIVLIDEKCPNYQ